MRPQRRARMPGSTARAHRKAPFRFHRQRAVESSSVSSSKSREIATPALLTSGNPIGPSAASAERTISCTAPASAHRRRWPGRDRPYAQKTRPRSTCCRRGRGGRAHCAHRDRDGSSDIRAGRPHGRGRDGTRLRRWRPCARLHQQGLRVLGPDRPRACGRTAAEPGAGPGGRPGRGRVYGVALSCGSHRLVPGGRREAGGRLHRAARTVLVGPRRPRPAPARRRPGPRLLARSRPRSGPGRCPRTSGAHWPMRPRFVSRGSATPTSTPTGKPPTTSSPTPTPSTSC